MAARRTVSYDFFFLRYYDELCWLADFARSHFTQPEVALTTLGVIYLQISIIEIFV